MPDHLNCHAKLLSEIFRALCPVSIYGLTGTSVPFTHSKANVTVNLQKPTKLLAISLFIVTRACFLKWKRKKLNGYVRSRGIVKAAPASSLLTDSLTPDSFLPVGLDRMSLLLLVLTCHILVITRWTCLDTMLHHGTSSLL